MPPVRATFDADFASFHTAVDNAVVKLRGFEAGTINVEKQLNRMVDSFSGRRIITEATQMAEAVERIGGVSKLTEAELARVSAVASEAAAKFRAWGQEVPTSIGTLADHSTKARTANEALSTSLSRFDGVLSSVGLNVSSEVRAINEMADAAGRTSSEIGLLSTAGLALGAGFAGWKVGRMIADFFDLDTKIANTTARLLGYGDLAAEVAGAKQDTINAAIRRGADVNITYADAIVFSTAKVKEQSDALAKAGDLHRQHEAELKRIQAEEERWGAIMGELNAVGGNFQQTLDGLNGEVVEAIKFYLEAGVSQHTLSQAYGVTASQIHAVTEAMKEERAWLDFEEAAKKRNVEITKLMTAATNDLVIAKLREAQAQEAANAAFLASELAAAQAADKAMFGTGGGISPVIHGNAGPAINSGGQAPFTGINTGAGAVLHPLSGLHPLRQHGGPASAGQSYVVGERGPELFTPGASGFVSPLGGGGPNITIYVNGTAEDVARKIADTILRTIKSGTKVGLA